MSVADFFLHLVLFQQQIRLRRSSYRSRCRFFDFFVRLHRLYSEHHPHVLFRRVRAQVVRTVTALR